MNSGLGLGPSLTKVLAKMQRTVYKSDQKTEAELGVPMKETEVVEMEIPRASPLMALMAQEILSRLEETVYFSTAHTRETQWAQVMARLMVNLMVLRILFHWAVAMVC